MQCTAVGWAALAYFAAEPLVLYAIAFVHESRGVPIPAAMRTEPPSPYTIVSWAFYLLVFFIFASLAVRSRDQQPFKARNFALIIVSALSGLCMRSWAFLSGVLERGETQCHITRWMVTLLYPAMVLPYLLRALRLRLVFNWATKRSLLRDQLADAGSRHRQSSAVSMHRPSGGPAEAVQALLASDSVASDDLHLQASSSAPSPHASRLSESPQARSFTPQHAISASSVQPVASLSAALASPIARTPPTPAESLGSLNDMPRRGSPPASTGSETVTRPAALPPSLTRTLLQGAPRPPRYSDRRLLVWLALALAPFAIYASIEQALDLEWTPTFDGCTTHVRAEGVSHQRARIAFGIFHAVEALALFVALSLIWRVWDEFNMRGELLAVFASDLLVAALLTVDAARLTDNNSPFDASRHLVSLRCALFFVASVAVPVSGLPHVEQHSPLVVLDSGDPNALKTLEGVLGNLDAYDAFERFMFAEHASSLLSFYVEVELFRDLADPQERRDEACRVYQMYLDQPDAVWEAGEYKRLLDGDDGDVARHLPLHLIEEVNSALSAAMLAGDPVDPHLFDYAQNLVMIAMRRVFFPRFQRSQHYARLVSALRERAVVKSSLTESHMVVA